MFNFFKKNTGNDQPDAKSIRDSVLRMIKEELQQLDGGEGSAISEIGLFVNANAEESFIYEAALYSGQTEKLAEDIQRIADNFALDLPSAWKLNVQFTAELPAGAIRREGLKAGLILKTASPVKSIISVRGRISILKGKAEQDEYILEPGSKRINIGRESSVQANDGSFRTNDIAFPGDPAFESNKYISRQHAHIEWDDQNGCFRFFADEGGVPPGNKTKIRSAKDETIDKLNSTQIGYPMYEGDQLILGDAAVLEFTVVSI